MTLTTTTYSNLSDLPNNIWVSAIDASVANNFQDWPSGVYKNAEILTFKFVIGQYGYQILIVSSGVICMRRLSTTWQPWVKTQLA